MKVFATSTTQVGVRRLPSGGGCAHAGVSLRMCITLFMCSLLLCRLGSKVLAELSDDGQLLLNFAKANSGNLGACKYDLGKWSDSDDTPCRWTRVLCNGESAVQMLDFSGCSLSGHTRNLSTLSGLASLQVLNLSSNPSLRTNVLFKDYLHLFQGLQQLDVSGTACLFNGIEDLRDLQSLYADRGCGRLSGVVPENLVNVSKLEMLDLSDNSLSGSIPNLEGLTRLTHLKLTNNSLRGEVPTAPNLLSLDAALNNFTDFPDAFFLMNSISSLEMVNLSWNQLGGQIPDFGGLQFLHLTVLDLSWNHLHGPILSALPNLTQLNLSHNNLSGPIPANFVIHDGGRVDLSGNELNGSIPPSLLYPSLRGSGVAQGYLQVNLSRNSLVGSIPENPWMIPGNASNVSLDLSDNQLDGSVPSSFGPPFFTKFHQLWLQNNQLSRDLIDLLIHTVGPTSQIRVHGNQFSGDLTKLLWIPDLFFGRVFDLSDNNFNMTPSGRFSNPLQSMLEKSCSNKTFNTLAELRLAGTNLMGIPLPDTLNCTGKNSLDSLRILDLASCNLNGAVPGMLFNISMPKLTFLNLSNNRLSGPIPPRLPVTLQNLDVSYNNLEGTIPAELFSVLPDLVQFNAAHCNLSGPIPDTFPQDLQVLDLRNNSLSGEIPGTFFFALPNLKKVNLSGNKLSGPIPGGLQAKFLNLSIFADNPGLCGDPLPPCRTKAAAGVKPWVLVEVVLPALLVCAASCLFSVWRWRVYSKKHQQDADLIATLVERGSVTVMPLRELRKATSNFSDSGQIGAGGFGTVYFGNLADGTPVAIKKGKREGSPQYKSQFLNEVRILSGVSHRHLVKLRGCSMENNIAVLVLEFVPNGTLKEHLRGSRHGFSPLTWRQRLLIAQQTAEALAYLHSAADPPIIHRDIKSCNILLDNDFNAKVADFGISKLAPTRAATYVSTMAIHGTPGYIDPEYYTTLQLTPRSDVYGFGVVLLELLSSKPAIVLGCGDEVSTLASLALSAVDSGEWQDLIDPVLGHTYSSADGRASIASVAALAIRCLAPKSRDRPEMKEVRNELQTLCVHWDSDTLSSSSSDPDHARQTDQPQNACGDDGTSSSQSSWSYRSVTLD